MSNTHHIATKSLFEVTDTHTKNMILAAIATRYKITTEQALEKITNEKAKSLLDYLTGATRSAIALAFRAHGISA